MSTNQLRKRVGKIEQRVGTHHDGLYTLEELCRMMWRDGGREELKADSSLRCFAIQFEREDAEREALSLTKSKAGPR